MPHGSTIVPRTDPEFDQYIRNSTTHLLKDPGTPGSEPNFERLGITVAQKDDWVAFRDDWVDVYPKFTDLNTSTKTIRDEKNKIRKEFIEFSEKPLLTISGSPNIALADRNALNLPERDREPTARGKITTAPDVNVVSLAGGFMKIRCRIDEDADRASLHPLADVIEMKYLIGTAAPPTVDDAPNNFISKKALFNFEAGTGNGGQRLYIFCRWVNQSNPANNGPWTTVHSGTIQS